MRSRAWLFPVLVGVVVILGWPLSYTTFAWVPVPLLLSTLIAHTARKPARWLIWLAIFAELFTTFPLGVMTIAVFLPYFVKRLAYRIEIDVSVWFFLYVLGVVALQILCVAVLPYVVAVWSSGWQGSLEFLPWPMALVSLVATTVAVFALLVVRSFTLPSVWMK